MTKLTPEMERNRDAKRKATLLERYGPDWKPGPKKGSHRPFVVDSQKRRSEKLERDQFRNNELAFWEWFQRRFAEHYSTRDESGPRIIITISPKGHGIVETIRRMSDATIYKCACGEEVMVTGMEIASFGEMA